MNTPPRSTGPQSPHYAGPRPPGPSRRPARSSGGGGGGVGIVLAVLLLAGAGGGAYWFFQHQVPVKKVVVTISPRPVAEAPVMPPEVKKEEQPRSKPVVQSPVAPKPKPAPAPMPVKKEEPKPTSPSTEAADAAKLAALFEGVLPLDERTGAMPAVQQRMKDLLEAALTQGKTAEWLALLRKSLLASLKAMGASSVTPQGLMNLAKNPVFNQALAQEAFLASLKPETRTAMGRPEMHSFYAWLLATPAALESWLLTIHPTEDTGGALDQWAKLAQEDLTARDKYRSLAIACALVFKKPMSFKWNERDITLTAAERYGYYKRHAVKGDLVVTPDKLTARDLVWTVGSRVPESELEWALQKMRLRQKTWGSAYDMVTYDMEKAVKGTTKYDGYLLSEILKKGGICGDRAYFAANTARAAGIPAAEIGGDGSRGGHAWISWMSADNEWKFSGRYAGYPLGHTRNPQTGKSVSEQELIRRSDRSASDEGMLRGLRAVWLAQAVESESVDVAALLFDGASVLGDKIPAVWQAKLAFWGAHKAEAPVAQWHGLMDALKRSMKDDPDMLTEARAAEEKFVFPRQDSKLAMTDLKKDARRLEKADTKTAVDQADQVAKVIKQQAEVLQKSGSLEAVRTMYDKSYREHGKNPAVFKKLANDCWSIVKADPEVAKKACHDMESSFKRYVNSGGDFFDVKSQMSALNLIAKCYREIGEEKKADTLAKDVAKANEKAGKRAL